MKLQNLMEERQLNLSKPLLSVRRGSSTGINDPHPSLSVLPYHKSDLKSGPVRNPGVIPFQWEQSPGRPKNKIDETITLRHLPPKLPPSKVLDQNQDKPVSSSRSYPETIASSWDLSSWEKAMSVLQEPDEEIKISSLDEDFEDARDRLSRTDSFFFNCSVNGVIGFGLDDQNNAESSKSFSDPQARDFMMGRFLPAAKTVASEAPQFGSRKHQSKPAKEDKDVTEKTVYIDSVDYSLQDIKSTWYQATSSVTVESSGLWGHDSSKKQPLNRDQNVVTLPLGLSPLLPKSPSESWLSRTLMSPKNPSLKSFDVSFRPSPVDPKCDRMLRTCIVKQHMLVQPFGELTPILED